MEIKIDNRIQNQVPLLNYASGFARGLDKLNNEDMEKVTIKVENDGWFTFTFVKNNYEYKYFSTKLSSFFDISKVNSEKTINFNGEINKVFEVTSCGIFEPYLNVEEVLQVFKGLETGF